MAIQCPKCGSTNPDNARFCWNDGEKLVTTGFQPFRFRSGATANSLSELVTQIDSHWGDGKYHLYQGDFANWLGSIGRADLASEARTIVSNERDQDIGLEKFLQRFGSDAPPPPQLQVSPTALDLGTVDGERVASSNPTRQFRISNTGRGHLYGTIQSSDPWLAVGKEQFSGNTLAITARATREGKQATIHIDSNGGKQAVPVRMNPVRPWYRIGWVRYTVAFVLIGLGELFPAIALVNSAMNQGDATVFFGLLGTVWGALIGLGIACLLTRIKIRWKGYLALFLVLPFSNVCIFFMLFLLFVLVGPHIITEATPGGEAVVSVIVSPLISCFYTYCKSRYIGIDVLGNNTIRR